MSTFKAIRERLGLTQSELGERLGCSQGNVGFYERGEQELPPDRAKKLVTVASEKGLPLSLDQVYGLAPLPDAQPGAVA